MREKALHDKATALQTAKEKGIAEGIEKGRAEIIDKLRKKGFSEEEIQDFIK